MLCVLTCARCVLRGGTGSLCGPLTPPLPRGERGKNVRCLLQNSTISTSMTRDSYRGYAMSPRDDLRKLNSDHLERARALRGRSTYPERLLWSRLRGGRIGPRFRRQQPIGPYIVDYYCAAARLIVEVDGRSHDRRRLEDEQRERWLQSQGYCVLRVTNDEVLKELDHVVERIWRFIRKNNENVGQQSTPKPPLPTGGEGGGKADG